MVVLVVIPVDIGVPVVLVFVVVIVAMFIVVIRPQIVLVLAVFVVVLGNLFQLRVVIIRGLPVGLGLWVDGCRKAGIHQPIFTGL